MKSRANAKRTNRKARAGRALEALPYSTPPAPVKRAVPDAPPAASFPMAGSEVLDVTGSEGAPRRDMHDVIRTPDDEAVARPLGPLEEANVSFRPDPAMGDAGADFADELGRSYLRAATTGEDISEIENADEMDPSEIGGPFLEVDTNASPDDTDDDSSSIDDAGLRLIGGSIDIPRDERGEATPATPAPSGEVPPELEEADDGDWPEEKSNGE
jgi:hypothetical protein